MSSRATAPVALGIDIGSSGVRIAAVDASATPAAIAAWRFTESGDMADPACWWRGVQACFAQLRDTISLAGIAAVAVDGTSGSVLAVDADGTPLAPALMYNQPAPDPELAARVDAAAPADSAARGSYSALARAACLAETFPSSIILHQADWIGRRLVGGGVVTDENNALKTGYDLTTGQWPDWFTDIGFDAARLPSVVPAGTPIGQLGSVASELDLPRTARLVSGTTDGCASFLATGAENTGDAVTALGSTLVLKLLSNTEIKAPQYGIYSHRLFGLWLAGGASNTGGAVLNHYFDRDAIASLTEGLQPDVPTGLDYYPLLAPGERFPVNDPQLTPRLTPRPKDDTVFFQAMLEGIASIERDGYRRLTDLGAPPVATIRTVGGGAGNLGWTRIRQAKLNVSFLPAASTEAAVGTARLALRGIRT